MRLKFLLFFCCLSSFFGAIAQQSLPDQLQRPRLVIGIVVDQMRWDFLYRYYDQYGEGGFKRLLHQGYSCNNVLINYLPSYTATGHTCIFTGSVPAITGITGNDWIDQASGKDIYCTSDSSVKTVGSPSDEGMESPANLLVSTVTDELRLATNGKSRVVGISLKDRAAILPAGHMATAAFWLDDATGRFISSTYYMDSLPGWTIRFNDLQPGQQLLSGDWHLLLDPSHYTQSTADNSPWEGKFKGETEPVFPHLVSKLYAQDKGIIRTTPFGNTLTLDFARAAVVGYGLGHGQATDFLTINCASTDYVGHKYGPNSMEVEDTYLRLDRDLDAFFTFLDQTIGKGNWMVFLTADHGVAHNIGFMQAQRLPASAWDGSKVLKELNTRLQGIFGVDGLVRSVLNYQFNLDQKKITDQKLDPGQIMNSALDFLQKQPGILYAIDLAKSQSASVPEPIKTMVTNGYYAARCGQIQVILDAGWFEGEGRTGTTHGSWNPYDAHIPLLFIGWHIRPGSDFLPYYMTDIAPTVAALLHIQMPNGSIGNPIPALLR